MKWSVVVILYLCGFVAAVEMFGKMSRTAPKDVEHRRLAPPSIQQGLDKPLAYRYSYEYLLKWYSEVHKRGLSTPSELQQLEQELSSSREAKAITAQDALEFANGLLKGLLSSDDPLTTLEGCVNAVEDLFASIANFAASFAGSSAKKLATSFVHLLEAVGDLCNNCSFLWDIASDFTGWGTFWTVIKAIGNADELYHDGSKIVSDINGHAAPYTLGYDFGKMIHDVVGIVAKRDVPPANWTCDPTWYNAKDGCDCSCGAIDPDCYLEWEPVFGCGNTNSSFDARCNFDTATCEYQAIPAEWKCKKQYYNKNDGCDCQCGAPDPDCDLPGQPVYGCRLGVSPQCVADHCQYGSPVPSTWLCPPQYYNNSDGCDCTCGAYDPDCDVPFAVTYFCPCSSMKCHKDTAMCEGVCEGINHIIEPVQHNSETNTPQEATTTSSVPAWAIALIAIGWILFVGLLLVVIILLATRKAALRFKPSYEMEDRK